jgi:4-amino-4-deoxy-L-arabinose transferase-like glycosyltransferase
MKVLKNNNILSFLKDNLIYVILIVAFILRIVNISNNPISLNQDEAVNGYDAYSIGLTLKDHRGNFLPFAFQSFGDWVSPLLTYITVPFVKILGLNIFSIRLPTTIIGTLCVLLMYFIILRLSKKVDIALITALIVAISGALIHLSRWAIPPSIVPFFLLLFLISVFYYEKNKNNIFSVLFIPLSATLTTYSYPTLKLYIPLLMIFISIIFLRKNFKHLIIVWLIYLLLTVPIFLPVFIDKDYNSRFNSMSILTNEEEKPLQAFFSRYANYLSPKFFFGYGDHDIMHQIPEISLIDNSLIVFYVLGLSICIYQLIYKSNSKLINVENKIILFLILAFFAFPIPASLTRDRFHLLRSVQGLPLAIIFISFGIDVFLTNITKIPVRKICVFIIILINLYGLSQFIKIYFNSYPDISKSAYQYGLEDMYKFLIKNEDRFKNVVIDEEINQPYIFYLFYSLYNPQRLTRSQINDMKIGKYVFRYLNDEEIKGLKTIIHQSCDIKQCYYNVYDFGHGNWIVKKI